MTFTEYTRYQPPPGFRDELINGELYLSPSPNRRHQDLCHAIQNLLERIMPPTYVVRMDRRSWHGRHRCIRPHRSA
jgi:Uma2 family endonuclease